MMSYVLVRQGYPPFVLSPRNAAAYFDPSRVIRDTHKKSPIMLFRMPRLRRRLADVLLEQADPHYLVA